MREMKKRFNIFTLVIAVAFSVIATFQMTYVFCARRQLIGLNDDVSYDSEKLAYVDEIYRKYFVGEMDGEELTDAIIRGYLKGAGEVFGNYLTAEELTAHMSSVEGELVGIGVNVVYDSTTGLVQIVATMEGSPAAKAGIMSGDFIYAVDGKSVEELGYDGVLASVAGKAGTEVSVTMLRPSEQNATYDFTMTRELIEEQSVYYRMCNGSAIGLIRITGFNANTPKQFKTAVDTLTEQGMSAVVFDLRNNPGGQLNSVASILDQILPKGDIIIATDKDGNNTVLATSAENELDMPMAVLTNGSSASAAELFAGCIRDYEKGPLIGETTYGKGSMQTLLTLPDGSAVSVTYRKFTSPSGKTHDGVGITPDIEVTLPEEHKNTSIFLLTEEQDTVLGEAIKYLNGELADN